MDINATFIGQALAFAILIWFSYKFVWPPMMGAMPAAGGANGRTRAMTELAHHKTCETVKANLKKR